MGSAEAMPSSLYWSSTASSRAMLPSSTSMRIRCQPSDSTACSRPLLSVASASQGASRSVWMLSGSAGSDGTAMTRSVPGSRSACQMIRASGAARSGSSAKVKPPLDRLDPRLGVAARRVARPRVPGDVAGIAAQPFPHEPGAIYSAKARIAPAIAPPFRAIVLRIAGHARAGNSAARVRRLEDSDCRRRRTCLRLGQLRCSRHLLRVNSS